ncbi:MAG: YraN family protein [Thermoleophilia bacterium]|nr:YraN family protein [Thermoleophilia bacterium]
MARKAVDMDASAHPDHALGAAGEAAAARWLLRRGWRILATGWRGGGGEIDIVAERRGIVAACEVKTRTSVDPHSPPLGHAQRDRLARAAMAWAARHPAFRQHVIRPDLIIVCPRGPGWDITRIEDVTPDRYSNRVRSSP